ncbi:MAG: hypothetical protein MZV70_03550 [Desulfobacterales bacterium]|nr:hypothetical protein [Desulfobacterales bacterium]
MRQPGRWRFPRRAGKTWATLTQRRIPSTGRHRTNVFWCRFNGTWTANPSVAMLGTSNNIVRMLVFSGDYGTATDWYVDVAEASNTYTAATAITIPAITVAHTGTLGVLSWTAADDNAQGTLTAGWTALTPTQVRNTSGTYDQSVTNAYRVFAATGQAAPYRRRSQAPTPERSTASYLSRGRLSRPTLRAMRRHLRLGRHGRQSLGRLPVLSRRRPAPLLRQRCPAAYLGSITG